MAAMLQYNYAAVMECGSLLCVAGKAMVIRCTVNAVVVIECSLQC